MSYLETTRHYASLEEIVASIRTGGFVLRMPGGGADGHWVDLDWLRSNHYPGSLADGSSRPRYYHVLFPGGRFRFYVTDPTLRG